jgi:hypothetical protein
VKFTNIQRLVNLSASTLAFTWMMTDPTTYSRKRVLLFKEFQSLLIPAVIDQGDKTLDTDMGGTRCFTGCCSFFVYAECTGNSLRVLFVDGFAKIEFFVVLVWAGDRTNLCALAAACAFCLIYISG